MQQVVRAERYPELRAEQIDLVNTTVVWYTVKAKIRIVYDIASDTIKADIKRIQ